ncbi:phosphate signaling complex protein PhoU [Clostridium sp. 'deep sea']|uniref:phosphate signaling complex protein PhoU n=1 Tax=Clostridium sp. 'deep sea' TaxID=2779445 RepID=UPI0018968ECC|nr:phosphate signaling complex protein PhoU [Clostridium sp. 'deep sea']QOR35748.1 phosphate signaling complex protein PhoU [Clostridium sp. 'deep sea']
MTRDVFHEKLKQLFLRLLKMGTLVEETIQQSVNALASLDIDLAQKIIANDDNIDNLETQLEQECLTLLATQQPLAKDLRLIGATLKVITDLERIADHAVDISRVTINLKGQKLVKPLIDIPRMAGMAIEMLHDSLTALIEEDVDLAKKIGKKDDFIDDLNKQIFRELLLLMMSNPTIIEQATQLQLVSLYLERIGDHATNIAEWVYYISTGEKPPSKW